MNMHDQLSVKGWMRMNDVKGIGEGKKKEWRDEEKKKIICPTAFYSRKYCCNLSHKVLLRDPIPLDHVIPLELRWKTSIFVYANPRPPSIILFLFPFPFSKTSCPPSFTHSPGTRTRVRVRTSIQHHIFPKSLLLTYYLSRLLLTTHNVFTISV